MNIRTGINGKLRAIARSIFVVGVFAAVVLGRPDVLEVAGCFGLVLLLTARPRPHARTLEWNPPPEPRIRKLHLVRVRKRP